jgi:hypothetical protein
MAWFVVIRKDKGRGEKKLVNHLFYVTKRKTKGGGYEYKFQVSKIEAKVFYNEETANEWADDIRHTHPEVRVLSEKEIKKGV